MTLSKGETVYLHRKAQKPPTTSAMKFGFEL
ncbi:MAG: hypothetical protein ACI9EQ_002268 [Bacteroidia bacterium]|jgi:hypothetical protein